MEKRYLILSMKGRAMKVRITDILMIERVGRKLRLTTKDEVVEFYEKLDNVEPLLDENFYRCLQGCFMNFAHVVEMNHQVVRFDTNATLMLGEASFRRAKKEFLLYLKKYNQTDEKHLQFTDF